MPAKQKKYYETAEFKALEREFYSKLPDDIEKEDNEYILQPQVFTEQKTQTLGGLGYYEFCQKVLREYNFKRDVDQVIFEQHTEGKSVREIEAYLKKNDLKPLKSYRINLIINEIKEKFGRG